MKNIIRSLVKVLTEKWSRPVDPGSLPEELIF